MECVARERDGSTSTMSVYICDANGPFFFNEDDASMICQHEYNKKNLITIIISS